LVLANMAKQPCFTETIVCLAPRPTKLLYSHVMCYQYVVKQIWLTLWRQFFSSWKQCSKQWPFWISALPLSLAMVYFQAILSFNVDRSRNSLKR
jgi:hypothetical protein